MHFRQLEYMAENNLQDAFEKTIKFNLLIEGRDELGKFIAKAEQLKGLKKVAQDFGKQQEKLRKQISKATASTTASLKRENKLLRGKDVLQGRISKTQRDQIKVITRASRQQEKRLKKETQLIRQNLRMETKLNRTRQKLARRGRGGGAVGGLPLGRIGAGVAGLGLGFAFVRQIQNLTDKRLEAALNLGAGATGRIGSGRNGIAGVSKFAALNEFLSGSTSQFIQGQNAEIQAGLLRAQKDLSNLGSDVANRLLADVSKSFGPDVGRRKEFFETVGAQGVEPALEKFIGQFNFPEFSRAINALQETDDPTLKIRGEFAKTIEQAKDSFERLTVTVGKDLIPIVESLVPKLVDFLKALSNLTTGDLLTGVAVGAGGLIAGGAVVRGGARLAAQALPAVARGLIPTGIGTAGAAGAAGVAGAAALAAPIAIGGAVAINETNKTREALTAALAATERQSGQLGRLDRLAQSLRLTAVSQREQLTAQRLKLDRLISGVEPAGTERSLIFGRQLSGEFTPQQDRQLETLRTQRRTVQADIDALDSRRVAEVKATQATKAETKAIDEARKSAENFGKSVTPRESIGSRIERREELQLPRQVQGTISAIRREELGAARISPFGSRLALDELESLNESLRQQRDNLHEILTTFDEDDPRGLLEANKVRAELAANERELRANAVALTQAPLQLAAAETDLRRQEFELARLSPLGTISALPELSSISDALRDELKVLESIAQSTKLGPLELITLQKITTQNRLELRRNERALLDIFRDSVVSQALGAGRFSEVLFTDKQNVGIGLRQGVFGLPKEVSRAFLGNVDPSIKSRQPVRPEELLAYNPFKNINKTRPRGVTPPVRRVGSSAADSLANAGKYLVQISEKMKEENQGVQNQIAEPITSPGRLASGVQ